MWYCMWKQEREREREEEEVQDEQFDLNDVREKILECRILDIINYVHHILYTVTLFPCLISFILVCCFVTKCYMTMTLDLHVLLHQLL